MGEIKDNEKAWDEEIGPALCPPHGQAPTGAATVRWIPPDREGEYHASLTITAYREPMVGWEHLYRVSTGLAPAAVVSIGYGPKVTVKRRCSDCKACNSESYAVQGDSGHYVYCEHPSLPERKYIGDTHWDTPDWCPAAAPTTQPATQPSPAAQGDALDAERYRWLRIQDSEDFEFAVVKNPHFDVFESPEELDSAIDAARAAQEGK